MNRRGRAEESIVGPKNTEPGGGKKYIRARGQDAKSS